MYASATMRVHTATMNAVESTPTTATTTTAANCTATELDVVLRGYRTRDVEREAVGLGREQHDRAERPAPE